MSGVFFVNANPPFHFASGGKIIISIYYIPEACCVELPQFHSGKNIHSFINYLFFTTKPRVCYIVLFYYILSLMHHL